MNSIAYRDPRRELFHKLKMKTTSNLFPDFYDSKHCFCQVDKYEARRKKAKKWSLNAYNYVIVCVKKKDVLKINLSKGN